LFDSLHIFIGLHSLSLRLGTVLVNLVVFEAQYDWPTQKHKQDVNHNVGYSQNYAEHYNEPSECGSHNKKNCLKLLIFHFERWLIKQINFINLAKLRYQSTNNFNNGPPSKNKFLLLFSQKSF